MRHCRLTKDGYSKAQWKKGTTAKCKSCIEAADECGAQDSLGAAAAAEAAAAAVGDPTTLVVGLQGWRRSEHGVREL
jgi:hypothetical protein